MHDAPIYKLCIYPARFSINLQRDLYLYIVGALCECFMGPTLCMLVSCVFDIFIATIFPVGRPYIYHGQIGVFYAVPTLTDLYLLLIKLTLPPYMVGLCHVLLCTQFQWKLFNFLSEYISWQNQFTSGQWKSHCHLLYIST